MTILKGMTWNHPRGYDPMVAGAEAWAEKTGVTIKWDKRSLQDFESFPVEELARQYDLIVIDHPHVGQVTAENCLAPLDVEGRDEEREALSAGSVGVSFLSYHYKGRQWAFPIDAAAQVMAYRANRAPEVPTTWEGLIDLARDGHVLLPLRPPHSLMTFFTLAANAGTPCRNDGPGPLISEEAGIETLERLAELASLVPEDNYAMDPIAVLEALSAPEATASISPYIYGYVSYAMDGFRPHRLSFTDIPAVGELGPAGSALGGTGIAVSAFSENIEAATDFAYWIASGDVQSTLYPKAGGQPGHADGWTSSAVNATTNGFYRNTRETLENAYLRPRHNGYMAFQQLASDTINETLLTNAPAHAAIGRINKLFEESF
ncbi:extracellular solute-binding protein [Martelella endophytica]|uniref:ABC transporter substrate-binding protein n=1 Tax=Martelella endophytica TaxID=1486262 RepID=A0A0D5LKS7_MAREN|nr:extracellular solute-binding protein [Martelella endophytica]AJY44814.1 ABC transporter substrate-binding protein [Martelella endophytica]